MLVDAGEEDQGTTVVNYINSLGIKELKYVVATHPHSDHIGGMDDVINSVKVDNIIMPNQSTSTRCFEKMLDAVENNNVNVIEAKAGNDFSVGNFNCKIVGPIKITNETNDNSVVIKLSYLNDSILLTGDCSKGEESDIFCSSWTDNTVDYSQAFARREEETARERRSDVAATEYDRRRIASETMVESEKNIAVQTTADFRKTDCLQEQLHKDMDAPESDTDSPETILPESEDPSDEESFSRADEETEKRVTAAEVLETMKEDGRAAELMANREKLPLLPNCPDGENGVIECVKINPNDIGLLNMDNWRLGVNSFLTHGFYSYKYLMLGRVLFDEEDTNGYILGVPGEYSSKEKYLAGIFGFDRFIPVKETRIKTGSFGYWVVDLK